MDKEGVCISHINFHLTGFGSFGSVLVNPTEELINSLPKSLAESPIPNITLQSQMVVDVESTKVQEAITGLKGIIEKNCKLNGDLLEKGEIEIFKDIILHFGINDEAKEFHLELQAVNCLYEGNLNDGRILKEKCLTDLVCCTCDLSELAHILVTKGHPTIISKDAGTYLCNYIYYCSLNEFREKGVDVLFVHVPPFKHISKDNQLLFIRELLVQFAKIHLST